MESRAEPQRNYIRVVADDEFQRQLLLLRRTRRFLLQQGVAPTTATPGGDSVFSLGCLNGIRCNSNGSPPTAEDWRLLEEKQIRLQALLTPDLAHRFRLQGIQLTLIWVPVFLLIYAGVALAIAVFPLPFSVIGNGPETATASGWRYLAYLMWTSSLGALGALGFLAVNSLGIQRDATFDLSDRGLVAIRIILGALFGSIVSVPFFTSISSNMRSQSSQRALPI
jgi:hypothetical protein